MSRHHERKERNCLNCGTIVQGRFCHVCGQENIEPKETFWSMVTHFFNDITHFDGKFFTTLKVLLLKPGFLSKEYIRGRRASYLHPIRMYLFTSALFFLIFFSFGDTKSVVKLSDDHPYSAGKRDSITQLVRETLKKEPDNVNLQTQLAILSDTSKLVRYSDLLPYAEDFYLLPTYDQHYRTRKEYDSLQAILPPASRDSWFKRLWNKRAVEINEKYRYQKLPTEKISEAILHKLPYLLFVSLPFFALWLKLIYFRRKGFYYADHSVFTIHQYIFSFILMLFVFLFDQLADLSGWSIWEILIRLSIAGWAIYLYIAMKRFYGQGWGKTFLKFFLLNLAGLILLLILFVIFTLFAVFEI